MKKNLESALKMLAKNNVNYYSETATVVRTYRVKDVNARGEAYDPYKHLTCDVRLLRDDITVYGVRLSPAVLAIDSSGNVTDVVFDGTAESKSGTINVDVPLVGSFVFITWLDEENAFVSLSSRTESIIIGSSDGAYIDFYVQDESYVIEFVNTELFKIEFPKGRFFKLMYTESDDFTQLLTLLDKIQLRVKNSELVMDGEDIEITVGIDGKISIKNATENLKDILLGLIDQFISYLNLVSVGLSVAVPPVNVVPVVNNLNNIKTRVSGLLL